MWKDFDKKGLPDILTRVTNKPLKRLPFIATKLCIFFSDLTLLSVNSIHVSLHSKIVRLTCHVSAFSRTGFHIISRLWTLKILSNHSNRPNKQEVMGGSTLIGLI